MSDDVVGRFRGGQQLNGRPVPLTEWRVTSADPQVLATVAEHLGSTGDVHKWDTRGDEAYEVLTTSSSVDIILDGPQSVRSGMVLWGRKGKLRECDGVTQATGEPCACPSDLQALREGAAAGTACEPSVQVYFRLAAVPELGKFKFFSSNWAFAREVAGPEKELAAIGGPAVATLGLELIEYTTKAGKAVRYTQPVLTIKGAADA
jgi:hypothetical protein